MQNLDKSINDADKSTTKLRDNLDKVDTKMQDISVSAKDIVKVFDAKFLTNLQNIVIETSKLSSTITELYSHLEKAITKNVEAGEKLAEKLEESGKKSLSVVEIKAIETSSLVESMMSKIGDKSEEQSKKLAEQVQANADLIDKRSNEIAEKYDNKEIGLFNLKKHKENTQGHIEELKKYKAELEAAVLSTSLKYDMMALNYDKDSAEFKKAQEDKKAALEALQSKTQEVDKTLKDSNDSYLAVWKKQHNTIGKELDGLDKKIGEAFTKNTYGFEKFVKGLDNGLTQLKNNEEAQEQREKDLNDSKYKKKNEKLDKELANVNKELTAQENEKTKLLEEQQKAEAKAEKAEADIATIKQHFTKKVEEIPNENAEPNIASLNIETEQPNNEDTENEEKVEWLGSEEEITAAQERIAELQGIADEERRIFEEKQEAIDTVNNNIVDSERSVLLEQMRITDEKARLAEEKEKKDAEIEEKTRKRKEQLEKLEKIKAKAQHVVKIAEAVGSVAKGVATAWGYGPFIGPPMAALVAVQGAMQIKTMTEQLKYMEDGGLLNGKRHSQGGMRIQGTNIEVEGGEYVVNRESTNKNLGLIDYINSQRKELGANDLHSYFGQNFSAPTFSHLFSNYMEKGGQVPSFEPNVDISNSELLEGMSKIKIEPRVSVTDINTVHENMVKVDEWTGL